MPTPSPDNNEYDELDDGYDTDTSNPNVFKIRSPLEPPNAKIYSTQDLHSLIHQGMIDLNPPYQRDVVWPETKQIGLIDSIFRNFYIPPVVFAVQRDEEGEEVRVCVDGKQRLTSIQKFFDGQIPHRDTKTKKNYWYTISESAKGARLEVPDQYKKEFSAKLITCVEYHGLTSGMERDIFQRVQLGMTLTAAEKLQAISSPWAEWIGELESRHVAVEGGLSHVLEWDTKRGRDFQNLAHLVYCCDGVENECLPTAQKVDQWLSRVDPPGAQFKADIELVLRQFWNIASDRNLNYAFKRIDKRIAPVEFVFIGVLLFVLRNEDIKSQANAIYQLRNTIRKEHRDIRNNSTVGKMMWELVRSLREDPQGVPVISSSTEVKGKRRRKAVTGEDDEYKPGDPVRQLNKSVKTRSTKQARLS
ncbi:hypothetical protein AX16_000941 [Volvariella volvacea WC 439]|nr:hypothetical protein AX16_000941 [Volvariella volvacea WC 439]